MDKLWVVARNATNETRSTMFLAPDRSFFQTLVNLREATEFHLAAAAQNLRKLVAYRTSVIPGSASVLGSLIY